jgi:hypothetical protein
LSESKQVSVKIYLPEDLRARFKSACALQKVSMNQILLDFVEEWTSKNENLTPVAAARKEVRND